MTDSKPVGSQLEDHVSCAFRAENVAAHADQEEIMAIAARGPRGALALAGLSVTIMLAIWLAFFLFVYLPRGAVG
jgi:hypothetical protein